VNSHWHGDHIRGNQVFKDSTIIASQTTYEKMEEIHPSRISNQKSDLDGLDKYIQFLQGQVDKEPTIKLENQLSFLRELKISLTTLKLVLPNQTFKDEIVFHGSKRNARLFTLGGGHSFCDAMLYMPEDGVIFTGDLISVNCHPAFFDETNTEEWTRILEEVAKLDIHTVIPGHGSVGTEKSIEEIINYIKDLTVVGDNDSTMLKNYEKWSSPEIYEQNLQQLKKSRVQ
jgi:cyclase